MSHLSLSYCRIQQIKSFLTKIRNLYFPALTTMAPKTINSYCTNRKYSKDEKSSFQAQTTSAMVHIEKAPADPLEFFQQFLQRHKSNFIMMNLATLDEEFGVLNRTVAYRGIIDGAITYVSERTNRNCRNILRDPRISVTIVFPKLLNEATGEEEMWQVRLIGAEAVECNREQTAKLWQEEPLHAKIRSYICECGKPVDYEQLKCKHDELLAEYKAGKHQLEQSSTYIAFKFVPKRWDFYKSGENCIADRVQYRCESNEWTKIHVCA